MDTWFRPKEPDQVCADAGKRRDIGVEVLWEGRSRSSVGANWVGLTRFDDHPIGAPLRPLDQGEMSVVQRTHGRGHPNSRRRLARHRIVSG